MKAIGAIVRNRGLKWVGVLVVICATSVVGVAQKAVPAPIHGVTVDDTHDIRDAKFLAKVIDSLGHLSVKPTSRLVYTPGNKLGPYAAASYFDATKQIKKTGYVMGQPVDSYYMRCFTPADHLARFKDYVDTLGDVVDIWEIGNEINGDWLYGNTKRCVPKASVRSTTDTEVVQKMTEAYDYVKSQHRVTALTLYYNSPCGAPPQNEMFRWTEKNVPARMKTGLDYVLVSYYETDCGGHKPDWQKMFGRLAEIFSNSKFGISEFGYSQKKPSKAAIQELITRYYAIHPDVESWAGGGFFWEFAIDMVPYDASPDSLWSTINTALVDQK